MVVQENVQWSTRPSVGSRLEGTAAVWTRRRTEEELGAGSWLTGKCNSGKGTE